MPVVTVCPYNMHRLELMEAYNMTVFSHHNRFETNSNGAYFGFHSPSMISRDDYKKFSPKTTKIDDG